MGDDRWLAELEGLRPWLESCARRWVRHRGEAAELAQEAIVRCMQGEPRSGEKLVAYAATVLRNMVSRTWFHQSRLVRLDELCAEGAEAVESESSLSECWTGFESVEAEEVLAFLRSRSKRLPPMLREACEAHWFLGRSYREIADAAGIDEVTARVRCFKARRRLLEDPVVRVALGRWAPELGARAEDEAR